MYLSNYGESVLRPDSDRAHRPPQYGRFLQADPLGYDGDGPNLYAYVLNDPVNSVDQLGLSLDQNTTDGIIINCIGYDWCGTMTVTATLLGAFYLSNQPMDLPANNRLDQRRDATADQPQNDKTTWQKFKDCAAAQYGFGDGKTAPGLQLGKIASEIGALPVFKPLVGIPVIGESSSFTNVLNYGSHVLGINTRFSGAAVRGFTKAVFGSVRVATVLGRANVVIGTALLAYDATSIAICTSRDK